MIGAGSSQHGEYDNSTSFMVLGLRYWRVWTLPGTSFTRLGITVSTNAGIATAYPWDATVYSVSWRKELSLTYRDTVAGPSLPDLDGFTRAEIMLAILPELGGRHQ